MYKSERKDWSGLNIYGTLYGLLIGMFIPMSSFSFNELGKLAKTISPQYIDLMQWEIMIRNPLTFLHLSGLLLLLITLHLSPWLLAGFLNGKVRKLIDAEFKSISSNVVARCFRILWFLVCGSLSFSYMYFKIAYPILTQ
jgi:hypothetical protein